MNQHIRFCKSFDGSRIAYAVTGAGPPLVKAQHWLTHLEYEFESPLWKPWIEALSRDHTLLRMDQRACGLSDWDLPDISFEAWYATSRPWLMRQVLIALRFSGISRARPSESNTPCAIRNVLPTW